MAKYRDDLLEYCENKLKTDPLIEGGKMMGHPGFKISTNGKFFMFCVEDGFTLKLPEELYENALAREDVTPFQPMAGRKPMSTWIVWTKAEANEYDEDWDSLVVPAINYVASEPPNPKKKSRK